jgi:RNA polymerase sigma factor (sigma-70 family)
VHSVPDDARLIGESLAEPAAFAGIFDRHAKALLSYLTRRVGPSEAEPLLGELFRIAFESRGRYDLGRPDARPWLYGIAANLVMKHLRTLERRQHGLLRLATRSATSAADPFDDSLVDRLAAGQVLRQVTNLIDALPERDREVVMLYAWQELSYGEIAEAMGIPGRNYIRAVSGDPVADCASLWHRVIDNDPPPMTAYDNGRGGVSVLLASEPVPAGYTPLQPGPFQDTSIIELQETLEDIGSGLGSACFDEEAARDLTQRQLDRLGLVEWIITVDETRVPDGDLLCANPAVEGEFSQVVLFGTENWFQGAPSDPYYGYAASLQDELAARCLPLEQATDLARALAAETRIVVDGAAIAMTQEPWAPILNQAEDPDADCTRATITVGGFVFVSLRGPTAEG